MKYPAQSDIWRLEQVTKARPVFSHNGQSRVLGRFRQVFPLTIFPDELIVEELRIVWFRQMGPWANEIISIMATDIASVNAASGLFFGHVDIKSLTGGPQICMDSLVRRDVFKIRSLVEGIALTAREGLQIDNGNLEAERQSILRAGSVY